MQCYDRDRLNEAIFFVLPLSATFNNFFFRVTAHHSGRVVQKLGDREILGIRFTSTCSKSVLIITQALRALIIRTPLYEAICISPLHTRNGLHQVRGECFRLLPSGLMKNCSGALLNSPEMIEEGLS